MQAVLMVGVLAIPAVSILGRGAGLGLARNLLAEWLYGWLVAAACVVPPVATTLHGYVLIAGLLGLLGTAGLHEVLMRRVYHGALPEGIAGLLLLPAVAVSLVAHSPWPATAVVAAWCVRQVLRRTAPASAR